MVMNNKRRIVAFDFDGTITKKDSFIEFIRFAHGDWPFIKGVLKNSIMLAAYALHIYPNWKAKQKLFFLFLQRNADVRIRRSRRKIHKQQSL